MRRPLGPAHAMEYFRKEGGKMVLYRHEFEQALKNRPVLAGVDGRIQVENQKYTTVTSHGIEDVKENPTETQEALALMTDAQRRLIVAENNRKRDLSSEILTASGMALTSGAITYTSEFLPNGWMQTVAILGAGVGAYAGLEAMLANSATKADGSVVWQKTLVKAKAICLSGAGLALITNIFSKDR
jgi:hypothetical protein